MPSSGFIYSLTDIPDWSYIPTVKIEVQHFPLPPSSLEGSGKDEGGRGKCSTSTLTVGIELQSGMAGNK